MSICNNKNKLLRFTTAGSVDNGKSTLIGRLLYDSKSIFEDQYAAVASISRRKGKDDIDLALFTDGLRDEVELGITIDVAYRYFSTPHRRFIIADVPGHKEFTRNMVTGASTSEVLIVLIDVQQGITEQTKRHSYIASLLKIPKVIVCINKMDIVDWSKEKYDSIVSEYKLIAEKLDLLVDSFIPTSALNGDNVVERSKNMSWYTGNALLESLEELELNEGKKSEELRLPIQFSTDTPQGKKSHFGRVASGQIKIGDQVTLLPSKEQDAIDTIYVGDRARTEAFSPMSIRFTLKDSTAADRGSLIVHNSSSLQVNSSFKTMLCWLSDTPISLGATFTLLHTNQSLTVSIESVFYKIDVNSFEKIQDNTPLQMNDICEAQIECTNDLLFDSYASNRTSGSFVLVDLNTNATVAAGMIL